MSTPQESGLRYARGDMVAGIRICAVCHNRWIMCECGEQVQIDKVVDIFHVGRCPKCGLIDEPCQERIGDHVSKEAT